MFFISGFIVVFCMLLMYKISKNFNEEREILEAKKKKFWRLERERLLNEKEKWLEGYKEDRKKAEEEGDVEKQLTYDRYKDMVEGMYTRLLNKIDLYEND